MVNESNYYEILIDYYNSLKRCIPECLCNVHLCDVSEKQDKSVAEVITILNRELNMSELIKIIAIHDRVHQKYKTDLDAVYIQENVLNDSLFYEYPCQCGSSFSARNVVDCRGIIKLMLSNYETALGEQIDLKLHLTNDDILKSIRKHLFEYLDQYVKYNYINIRELHIIVFSISRIIYWLEKNRITNKMQSAEYVAHSHKEWQTLIDNAKAIRSGEIDVSNYDEEDLEDLLAMAIKFIKYAQGLYAMVS